MSRLSRFVSIASTHVSVRGLLAPRRLALLEERPETFLAFGTGALAGNPARRVPARRLVQQPAHLPHDGLGGTGGGGAGGQHVGHGRSDSGVERDVALNHLVDESDAQRARRIETSSARKEGTRVRLPDLRDDERRDDRWKNSQPSLREA